MNTRNLVLLGLVCLASLGIQVHTQQAATATSLTTSVFSTLSQIPRGSAGINRKEVAVGAAAPDWRLKTVGGETVALSELRGKVVVLDFWANWCGPCHKLTPLFDRLAREYQNQPVRFFTLSIWPGLEFNPQAFLKKQPMASTFLIGDDTVANNYGIWGVPTYIVIDPEGKISYFHTLLVVDPDALGKRLREAIEKALAKEQGVQSAPSQQTPALIAEEGRVVSVSRGSRALAFQITSTILKETRRINVVLPASYSQSSSDRRYPVTILLDVSRRRGH